MQEIVLSNVYTFDVKDIPNTHHRAYVAKVIGSHPDYVLNRMFLDLRCSARDNGCHYTAELEDFGVYEFSVKWYKDQKLDKDSDGFMYGYRGWFVQIDGYIHHYIKKRDDVLPELRQLKKIRREIEGDDVA